MKSRTLVWMLATLLLTGGVARAELFKEDRWGYKIRIPGGWTRAALSASEIWIASKHLGKRALEAKNSKFWFSDHPEIWVIGFPHKRKDDQAARERNEGGERKIEWREAPRDYKDFLKKQPWFVGGGYHFTSEEETEIDGVKVSQYEIKVDKMVSSPVMILTWVYHFDDIDFAIHCRVLADYYGKFKPSYERTLKSFRRIERKRALPGAAVTGKRVTKAKDESKMTPEELKKHRQEETQQLLQREIDNLPKDWYTLRSKHYVVMANSDRKFAKLALDHAEAVRGYLDKHFGDIGNDYVPTGIIRCFASNAEARAFWSASNRAYNQLGLQVTLAERSGSVSRSWAFEGLSDSLADQYFDLKNKFLSQSMPHWFAQGLRMHLRFGRSKGRRLEIKPDEWDREQIKRLVKSGQAIALRDLFTGHDEKLKWSHSYQYGSVVGFLLTKGNRGKFKNSIKTYIANLIAVANEAEAEYQAEIAAQDAKVKAAQSGEVTESEDESGGEEDVGNQAWEAKLAAMLKRAKVIREKAFESTFGDLSEKDWKRINTRWQKWAG